MERAIHFGKHEVATESDKREHWLVRTLDFISGTVMNFGLLLIFLILAVYAISSH